jgi:hypothetical protein
MSIYQKIEPTELGDRKLNQTEITIIQSFEMMNFLCDKSFEIKDPEMFDMFDIFMDNMGFLSQEGVDVFPRLVQIIGEILETYPHVLDAYVSQKFDFDAEDEL